MFTTPDNNRIILAELAVTGITNNASLLMDMVPDHLFLVEPFNQSRGIGQFLLGVRSMMDGLAFN